jgi:hypothetical protein
MDFAMKVVVLRLETCHDVLYNAGSLFEAGFILLVKANIKWQPGAFDAGVANRGGFACIQESESGLQ